MNALEMYAAADTDLDAATDAPARYATALTALVAEGWHEKVPMPSGAGRPTAAETAARKPLRDVLDTRGGKDAAKRQRVLRAIYAIHILAANGRRDGETDEAYVARVIRIRAIAVSGDRDVIDRALKGTPVAPKSRSKGRKPGTPGKAPKAPKTPEAPKAPASTGDVVVATYEEFRIASIKMRDAVAAHVTGGGKITKAMRTQIEASLKATHEVLEMLSA